MLPLLRTTFESYRINLLKFHCSTALLLKGLQIFSCVFLLYLYTKILLNILHTSIYVKIVVIGQILAIPNYLKRIFDSPHNDFTITEKTILNRFVRLTIISHQCSFAHEIQEKKQYNFPFVEGISDRSNALVLKTEKRKIPRKRKPNGRFTEQYFS